MSILATCALTASLLAAADENTWAVVGLAGSGVWATDVERVEDGVRQALVRAKAGRVQPRAATSALLTEARQAGLVCDVHTPACAARLGASAGVDRVLVLEAIAQAPKLRIDLVVIDVASEGITARAQREVDGASPDPAVLDDLALELAVPDRFFGTLVVEDAPPGARILVDGDERGTAPLSAPIGRLLAGRHAVEVKSGATSWATHVDIARGEQAQVKAAFPKPAPPVVAVAAEPAPTPALAEEPAPEPPPPAPLSLGPVLAIGGAAAFAIGGAGALGLALALESPMDAGTREGLRAGGVAMLGLLVVGGIAGGAGAALWLMEDGT